MRWHSCNVLDVGPDRRRLWHFDARNDRFSLKGDDTARNGETLPPNLIGKSWSTLFQKKLNVAWLPSDSVFLRVAQFPASTPDETRAMVELQLEKLSPIPVTQALWTMHVLPQTASRSGSENLQTIVVIMIARETVEQFLGKLEGQGYMADRLELPMFDQLQATRVTGDGAWVYPETGSTSDRALAAWWYGGTLQNLALLTLENGPDRIPQLKDQLVQMAWAGELEGWLTSPPRWHLVADNPGDWQSALREATEQPVDLIPPVPAQELAALTARRAAQETPADNLMPAEFASRYQQQFQDRLWGRGLLASGVIYCIAVAIFFVALTVFSHLTDGVVQQEVGLARDYTNSLQLQGKLEVLKQRETLKFAALDCYNAVAENLPASLTLDTMNFSNGRLSLRGSAPADQPTEVTDFYDALRKAQKNKEPLFNTVGDEGPRISLNPGGSTLSWSFDLDLKQTEKQ